MFVCLVQVSGSDGGKGRKTRGGGGGGIPVEEDRMDGWLDRTPQRGGREKGKMVGVEGTQDGDKE